MDQMVVLTEAPAVMEAVSRAILTFPFPLATNPTYASTITLEMVPSSTFCATYRLAWPFKD